MTLGTIQIEIKHLLYKGTYRRNPPSFVCWYPHIVCSYGNSSLGRYRVLKTEKNFFPPGDPCEQYFLSFSYSPSPLFFSCHSLLCYYHVMDWHNTSVLEWGWRVNFSVEARWAHLASYQECWSLIFSAHRFSLWEEKVLQFSKPFVCYQ